MLILEIQSKLFYINQEIEKEQALKDSVKHYKDCDLKTMIVHQTTAAIRTWEAAKEMLVEIITAEEERTIQMSGDEWLQHENKMKKIAAQVDVRGGMVDGPGKRGMGKLVL